MSTIVQKKINKSIDDYSTKHVSCGIHSIQFFKALIWFKNDYSYKCNIIRGVKRRNTNIIRLYKNDERYHFITPMETSYADLI